MPWADVVRLDKERELVGMYLSAHPLDPYYLELTYGTGLTLAQREELVAKDGLEVAFGGIVTEQTERMTRTGRKMMIVKLEDFSSSTEFIMFEDQAAQYGHIARVGNPVLVKGRYQANRNGDIRFNIVSIQPLEQWRGKLIDHITVSISAKENLASAAELLNTQISEGDGTRVGLRLEVYDPVINRKVTLASGHHIKINKKFLRRLDDLGCEYKVIPLKF